METGLRRAGQRLVTALAVARLVPSLLLIAVLKHLVPLPLLARWAWRSPALPGAACDVSLVVGRVLRAGRILGMPDRDCVQRSLVIYRELSRIGANPSLIVGFRRDGEHLRGHAWVERAGRAVCEAPGSLGPFAVVLRFGPEGAPVLSDSLSEA